MNSRRLRWAGLVAGMVQTRCGHNISKKTFVTADIWKTEKMRK